MAKKQRRDTPEKQSKRFIETAKTLEVDESGNAFERALGAIVQAKPKEVPPRKPNS